MLHLFLVPLVVEIHQVQGLGPQCPDLHWVQGLRPTAAVLRGGAGGRNAVPGGEAERDVGAGFPSVVVVEGVSADNVQAVAQVEGGRLVGRRRGGVGGW